MSRVAEFAIALGLVGVGCRPNVGLDDLAVPIPSEADWLEVGVVLEAGSQGSWDHYLAGASSPSTVIQHDGVWWLYYGGAEGLRDDGSGPRYRAIGVATSRDGVRFTKYGDMPVMPHTPTGLQEEGANSAAVSITSDGSFVMHYGAATQFLSDSIHADIRVARSSDGRKYEDVGLALSYEDSSVYGFGDELFPLASYHHEGTWYVFYLPNGSPQGHDLAVAWGPDALRLEQSALVLDGSRKHPARCGANVVVLDDHVIVFVQRNWKPDIRAEVRVAPVDAPWKLGPPLRIWDGPLFSEQTKFFTVTLDRDRHTWLLYRLDWNRRFVLHAAPAGTRDETRPGAPHQLTAERTSRGVRLRWKNAHDPESGVGQYRIRCDGILISESIHPSWEGEIDAANCAVSAVNLHGAESSAATISLDRRGDSD